MKEGLRKVKGKKDVSRQMAMMWMVSAKNSLGMKDGFSLNQFMFGRNPNLSNLFGREYSKKLREGERRRIPEGYTKCNTSN